MLVFRMAILPEYNFSAESGIKDSLLSQMSAVCVSLRDKGIAKEAVSFDEISGDVFGRDNAKKTAPAQSSPSLSSDAPEKKSNGAQIK